MSSRSCRGTIAKVGGSRRSSVAGASAKSSTRFLKGYATGTYPAKPKKPRNFPQACKDLEAGPTTLPHSMRILVPRVLPGIYDVRNNRNVGHVGGDVDPNHMDATLCLQHLRWILGELIRVFHDATVEDRDHRRRCGRSPETPQS